MNPFPDLSGAKLISIDLETRDDFLKEKGPGVRRGAYVIGVALATEDGFATYYPIRHDQGRNLDPAKVFGWLKKQLAGSQPKLGTNLLYDFDFLAEQGIHPGGLWYDIQIAEPLLDENNSGNYNLNAQAKKYLNLTKNEDELYRYCRERNWRGAPQKYLWRMPIPLVSRYAITDVQLPLEIFAKQRRELETEKLWSVFTLETKLMPLLLFMRRNGVRINVKKLGQMIDDFQDKLKLSKRHLRKLAGFDVQFWAADSIAQAFDKANIGYNLTPKSKKPSFTQEWLEQCDHELAKTINECRQLDKLRGTFLESQIKEMLIKDRLHCLFNQLRSDEFGTVSGRFSSSMPNLQFIPTRTETGRMIRTLFVPEPDHLWGKVDYSQIEFRIFAHFARGATADGFRATYNQDQNTDFHQWCANIGHITRTKAKTTNFLKIYGGGLAKLALQLGVSYDEAKAFSEEYERQIPFIKETLQDASESAQARGFVRTILGRKRRFNTWEPADWKLSKTTTPSRDKVEMVAYVNEKIKQARANKEEPPRPGVRRAGTHKAFNAVDQGSAADVMKKAMLDCYEGGIFDVVVPHLTVHDELDVSIPKTKVGHEAYLEMQNKMVHTIKFNVPLVVESTVGPNWGETK